MEGGIERRTEGWRERGEAVREGRRQGLKEGWRVERRDGGKEGEPFTVPAQPSPTLQPSAPVLLPTACIPFINGLKSTGSLLLSPAPSHAEEAGTNHVTAASAQPGAFLAKSNQRPQQR